MRLFCVLLFEYKKQWKIFASNLITNFKQQLEKGIKFKMGSMGALKQEKWEVRIQKIKDFKNENLTLTWTATNKTRNQEIQNTISTNKIGINVLKPSKNNERWKIDGRETRMITFPHQNPLFKEVLEKIRKEILVLFTEKEMNKIKRKVSENWKKYLEKLRNEKV